MTKDEALKMAIREMTDAIPHLDIHFDDYFEAIQACKEALEQQEVGDAEIKQMLNDIDWYQMRVKELESELEAITQHQILEAISNDVAKQQKDKQFYQSSLADMVKNKQPAQEPTYQVGEIVNPYGSNIKIKQTAQEFFEKGKRNE